MENTSVKVRRDSFIKSLGLDPNQKSEPKKVHREILVDGGLPEAVRTVQSALIGSGCPVGLHCAAHGDGPFSCCRCGAQFNRIEAS